MTDQPDLFTSKEPSDNPLVKAMRGHMLTGWITAKQFLFRYSRDVGLWSTYDERRRLRQWAEESDGQIISGNQGYILIEYATPEERKHAARRLISQGKKMTRRGIQIMRRAHQIEGR